MKWIIFLIPLLAFGYTPSNDRTTDTDFIKARNQSIVEMRSPLKGQSFTGDKALISDGTGNITESANISSTELDSLDNISGNIQTLLDVKANDADVVKLTGNQSIAGVKTFTEQFVAVSTTNGFRPCPVMTNAERDAIATPAEGDCVVSSDDNELNYYLGGAWGQVGGGTELTVKGSLIGFDGFITKECNLNATPDYVLTVDAAADCGFDFKAPAVSTTLSAKGEIQSHDGINNVAIPAPSSNNQYLISDDTQPSGWNTTNTILAQIGQAQFVGQIEFKNNCVWQRNSSLYGFILDIDGCSPTETIGNLSQPTDTTRAGIKINNFRTDGYYKFSYQGIVYNSNDTGVCTFAVSKNGSTFNSGEVYVAGGSAGSREQGQIFGNIKFNQGDTGEIFIIAQAISGANCAIYGQSADSGTFSVHFFPDSSSLVAVQNTELTKETVNEINIRSTSSVITSVDFGLTSDYTVSSGGSSVTLNYASLGLTVAPVIQALGFHASGVTLDSTGTIASTTTPTQAVITFQANDAGSYFPQEIMWSIKKQGADVNKSQTIVGNFEQIQNADVELNAVTSPINSVFITGGATPTILTENYKMPDGVTPWILCTRPSIGNYNCTFASGLYTSTPSCTISQNHPSTIQMGVNIESQSNTVLNFETFDGNTPFNVTAVNIICSKTGSDAPDSLKAVVINNQSFSKKCQKKELSADTGTDTTGIVADLTFNNLDLTKRYSLYGRFEVEDKTSVSSENHFMFIDINGFNRSMRYASQAESVFLHVETHGVSAQYLEPTSTTIQTNINIVSGGLNLNAGSWVELCELGDNVTTTTQFN